MEVRTRTLNPQRVLVVAAFLFYAFFLFCVNTSQLFASTAKDVGPTYLYNFNSSGVLAEVGNAAESWSPYWWVNSGGGMVIKNGRGSTLVGDIPTTDIWNKLYASSNPQDTDNGLHPQNIFRLITRSKWQDARQEAYFVIKKDNLSDSSNRNQSNGLLLFNRYQDSGTLYYTGVRVDGSAIIKKKLNGTYYTLAEIKGLYPGNYNHDSNPNLLPKNKWIGLRSEVINEANGSVRIKLYTDNGWTGKWKLVADVLDNGSKWGKPIIEAGYGGIRTDFMDVEFENFRFRSI